METGTLEKKIAELPEKLKLKVEVFVDALLIGERDDKADPNDINKDGQIPRPVFGSGKGIFGKMTDDFDAPLEEKPKLKREFGGLKGFVTYIADDFDAPLEDFKDYM